MKKSKFLFLFALFLVPLMLFTACDEEYYYNITVISNDSTLGGISPNTNSSSMFKGGTQVKLKATANPDTAAKNPFICWIKDDSEIVSTKNEMAITVGPETEGQYTALFEKTDKKNLMYLALREIQFDFDSEAYSTFDYVISYKSQTNSQQNEYMTGSSREATTTFKFDVNTPVIKIFNNEVAAIDFDLIINLTLHAKDSASGEYVDWRPTGLTIRNADFSEDENGLYVTTLSTTVNEHNFSLKFEKISKNSFDEVEPE